MKRTFASGTFRAKTFQPGTWTGAGLAPLTLVWAERVHETSRTKGTGAITLSGRAFNKRGFAAVLGAGDSCYGFIASQTTDDMWEATLLTMQSDGTLARAAVPVRSSNGGALVSFDGSALDVVLDVPANVLLASLSTPGYAVVAR